MKISGNGHSVQLDAYVKSSRTAKRGDSAAAPRTGGSGEDKVALSPQAMQVRRAAATAAQVPEVRQEKVAAIRQQISDGTYAVQGEKIAINLIKESLINEMA